MIPSDTKTVYEVFQTSAAAYGARPLLNVLPATAEVYGIEPGEITFANFFMATGFHGFHVIVGTIFLFVCLLRVLKGHFKSDNHVGFEAAAWYWHFVDVVWLFLFAAVYLWAG